MAGPGEPSPSPEHRTRRRPTIRRGGFRRTCPLRLSVKANLTHSTLAVGRRRVLVEAHQMRADALTIGRDRRGAAPALARRRPGPDVRRAAAPWCAAQAAPRSASSPRGGRLFGLTGVGFASGTGLAGSVAGVISSFCSGGATTSGFSCGGVGAICSSTTSCCLTGSGGEASAWSITRPGASSSGVDCGAAETGAMSTMIAGRVAPGTGRWVYQFIADRDQRGMRGDDRHGRDAPTPDDTAWSETSCSANAFMAIRCGRRGRPARS